MREESENMRLCGTGPYVTFPGEAAQEAVEARAEPLVSERLKAAWWTEKHLPARPKGDPRKVKLAAEVQARTTLPLAGIANRLAIGSRDYLSCLLCRQGNAL